MASCEARVSVSRFSIHTTDTLSARWLTAKASRVLPHVFL